MTILRKVPKPFAFMVPLFLLPLAELLTFSTMSWVTARSVLDELPLHKVSAVTRGGKFHLHIPMLSHELLTGKNKRSFEDVAHPFGSLGIFGFRPPVILRIILFLLQRIWGSLLTLRLIYKFPNFGISKAPS